MIDTASSLQERVQNRDQRSVSSDCDVPVCEEEEEREECDALSFC